MKISKPQHSIALCLFLVATLVAAVALTSLPAAGNAQETKIKYVPITQSDLGSGKQMYTDYCAACHGLAGRGDGPAAPALKAPVPDLTLLAKKNGGKYPTAHVVSVLEFGTSTHAHGSKDMPVWGPLFKTLHPGAPMSSAKSMQRISNLNNYIESLQAK